MRRSAKSSCSRRCWPTASARWSSRKPTRSGSCGWPSPRCPSPPGAAARRRLRPRRGAGVGGRAEPLLHQPLRAGDSLLLESRSGYVYERIPKAEVEELILEEVPDISYHDIGGLAGQIEQIRDAVELPYLHADLFKEHRLRPPKGI